MDSNLNIFSLTPVASSEGVWCFAFGENSMLLLWNPSIKKSVGISVPNYTYQPDSPKMIFGFGICPVTLEPTILKINYPLYTDRPWYVSVSTLSSRIWYNLDYDCLSRESLRIKQAGQVVIGGKIFWIGSERFYNDDGDTVIISESFDFGNFRFIYAWALEVEGGFLSSCNLLFTIPHPGGHYLKLLRFSKDNQPIVDATIVQQCEFHNNESNHQNESLFEKQECSFAFGDYHEYEDEKNEFDDVVDDNPLPNYQKWQKYMSSFKPDIPETPLYKSKPMISKHYKKETDVKVGQNFENKEALDLAIRLKALDEGYQFLNDRSAPERCGTFKGSIQRNKSDGCRHGWKQPSCANCFWYRQRGNRHAAIALAVQNEFPLAYHAAYTTEEFSSSMSHLQDIQPDVYDKLCQLGPQRWSRAHCPLVRYNYLTSNSVESVNACTVVYRKLPVLKLAKTYRAMVQDWYYKYRKLAGTYAEPIHFIGNVQEWEFPQHIRKAIPPRMDNPQPDFAEMISHLTRKISRRFTTVYYMLPPNNTLSGLKQIKNDYDTNVMYDIAKVAGKIQLFVSHHQIDLSTMLIPNDGSLEEAFAENVRLNVLMKLQEALDEEAILEEQILSLMHRFADRFTDRRVEINNLMVLHDHQLIDYGKYALGCMTGADMKKCVYLKSVRDELLRSMEEKRQLMTNYRDM
ncbi:hypothetical protein Tco_0838198 [Tanacetum coccineum]|uniref:Uncharacterized protein n=1 Tax=Tanacetum coccineum TaxID=301880 RepID=A0ABQ5AR06_9ASTR